MVATVKPQYLEDSYEADAERPLLQVSTVERTCLMLDDLVGDAVCLPFVSLGTLAGADNLAMPRRTVH